MKIEVTPYSVKVKAKASGESSRPAMIWLAKNITIPVSRNSTLVMAPIASNRRDADAGEPAWIDNERIWAHDLIKRVAYGRMKNAQNRLL